MMRAFDFVECLLNVDYCNFCLFSNHMRYACGRFFFFQGAELHHLYYKVEELIPVPCIARGTPPFPTRATAMADVGAALLAGAH